MKKSIKAVMAFLTAMTMTAGAMGVTAYAEDTVVTASAGTSPTGLTYEIDDPDYMAEIDEQYAYVPLEDIVLKFWNGWLMENEMLHREPREQKWYYKHIYVDTPDFKIDRHVADPRIDVDDSINTAESLHLVAEQGRADDIEARDGKVRKFTEVDIVWTILVADKEIPLDDINAFMKEKGLRSHVAQVTPKQFALHFEDRDFTNQDVLDAITALYNEYGILPGGIEHSYGTSELYYDSNYKGGMSAGTFTEYNTTVDPTEPKEVVHEDIPLEGSISDNINYKYNPNSGILLIDGDGAVTWKDNREIVNKYQKLAEETGVYVNYVVFGKNVQHDSKYDDNYAVDYPGCNRWLFEYTDDLMPFRVCSYKDSYTAKEFNNIIDYFTQKGKADAMNKFHLLMIDDNVDPDDLVSGKVDIKQFDNVTKRAKYTVTPTEETTVPAETANASIAANEKDSKATIKGDADLNGEVSLSDVTTVVKYNLNRESFPLKNETAEANADVNSDNKIDMLDSSKLIEININ